MTLDRTTKRKPLISLRHLLTQASNLFQDLESLINRQIFWCSFWMRQSECPHGLMGLDCNFS